MCILNLPFWFSYEYESYECIQTNILGVQNILESIHNNLSKLTKLETVIFISTDKACNPINLYGLCKACSEKMIIEKSKKYLLLNLCLLDMGMY